MTYEISKCLDHADLNGGKGDHTEPFQLAAHVAREAAVARQCMNTTTEVCDVMTGSSHVMFIMLIFFRKYS